MYKMKGNSKDMFICVISGKDANCMAIACNFTFSKVLNILALSISLIDVTGFKFLSFA